MNGSVFTNSIPNNFIGQGGCEYGEYPSYFLSQGGKLSLGEMRNLPKATQQA